MAARRNAGLTIGQSLTLAFGFTLGSVIIFVFGIWVGRDLAQQRQRQERPVVFKPVDTPVAAAEVPGQTAAPVVGVRSGEGEPEERPTRPRLAEATPVETPLAVVTRTATSRIPPTTTPAPMRPPTIVAQPRDPAAPASGAIWTVQATATNDQVQAIVLARGLKAKGYDAFTVQTDVAGVKWYRIQVGKFNEQKEAEAAARKLRQDGLEAAFVDRLR